jgi:hypothetical protein
MEELTYILNNHTQAVFILILVILFGLISLRFLLRRLRRKKKGRRFDDRR